MASNHEMPMEIGEDQVSLQLSIDWLQKTEASKYKNKLQIILQSWANKNKFDVNFEVVSASKDTVDIIIPAEGIKYLDQLFGQTLTSKDEKTSVTVKGRKFKQRSSSLDHRDAEIKSEEQSHFSSLPVDTFKAEEETRSHSVHDVDMSGRRGDVGNLLDGDQDSIQLSIDWSRKIEASKYKTEFEKLLQIWAIKKEYDIHFEVVSASEENANVIIRPAEALKYFDQLFGQTLISKDETTSVTVKSRKIKPRSSSFHQQEEEKLCSCSVPVSHFWYVNQIYKEEMECIEKNNGVKIETEVTVNFKPKKSNANLWKAYNEFTVLVQKSLSESSGFVIPFSTMAAEDCSAVLNIIKKYDNKLLLTISPKDITVCGPPHSQDAVKAYIGTKQIPTIKNQPSTATAHKNLTSEMKINDPLIKTGLSIDKDLLFHMKNSFKDQLNDIQTKFNVELTETSIIQGKVNVRACYRSGDGNVAMENHALRALLRLYHKTLTSPVGSKQGHNSSALNILMQRDSECLSEGAVGGLQLNGNPGYGHDNFEQSSKKSGNDEDDVCPICLDKFTNKKRLKCKHEFCEDCLERSKKTTGPICPLCKDVFGVVEGNQPAGTMKWRKDSSSLPGFPRCGRIVINYNIASGTQTKKHPNPGHTYHGVHRTAYLPDNKDGNEVLMLLKKAFDQKLIFTVGMSRTTGLDNQVTWNDIHHKTSTCGGPQCFGYPDDFYLSRVREELKAKGIE